MARKQLGQIDEALLDRVDERAAILGQTRRVFVERALLAALEGDMRWADPSTHDPAAYEPRSRADAFRSATQRKGKRE